ncbi:MAG: PAS domain-containing sensor histidine kinase [Nibricoccus sp.]
MSQNPDIPEPIGHSIPTTASGSPIPNLENLLLSAFLENIPDQIYFKDLQSRFITLSRAKAKRDGKKVEDYIGKTDFDFFADEHARNAFADEQAIIQTGRPILEKLEREVWPDGRVTWVVTNKLPWRDQQGKVIGTFGMSRDVTKTIETQKALEESNRQLMEATRQAGMAEVATGVLHNVGNVLTSINVTANLISDRFRDSKVTSIFKVCALLRDHQNNLGEFFANDPRAGKLPTYLESLATNLDKERVDTMADLATLLKSIDHIKDIIWMQQSYASVAGMVEPLVPSETIEDALKLSINALQRHNVHVEKQIAQTPSARAERHKVLQILVNLISNAKKAMDCKEPSQRKMLIRVENGLNDMVIIKVIDNGIGIPEENLTKIFSHGFTTRKDGHGFGLHSSALAAKQMGGELTAESAGVGQGATFTLSLPRWKDAKPGNPSESLRVKSPEECFADEKTTPPKP